jgi:hypothetical protein
MQVGNGWGYISYSKINGLGYYPQADNPEQTPYVKLSLVTPPSQAFVFIEEADPYGFNRGTWVCIQSTGVGDSGWDDSFAIFHGLVTTLGFADGHVFDRAWHNQALIHAEQLEAAGNLGEAFAPGGDKTDADYVWVWNNYRYQNWTPLP